MTAWHRMDTAPRDGTRFVAYGMGLDKNGRMRRRVRMTWWGKVSHVPLYGWCWGRDVEDISTWQPTTWRPSVSSSEQG